MAELPFLTGEQGRGPFLVLLFFISVTVVTVWGTWEGALPRSEEAVLAETAREIRVTGDYWTMHFDGRPIYDVPPLTMWIVALSLSVLGRNEFAVYLPYVIFSVLTLYVVFLTGRIASHEEEQRGRLMSYAGAVGFLSAIVLAASPLFGKFAPHATLGIPFSFFFILSLLGWFYLPGRRMGLALWCVGIAGGIFSAGAASLLLIPGSLLSLITDRTRRAVWRNPAFILSTVLGLAVGGVWLLPATLRAPGGFQESSLWALVFGFVKPAPGAVSGLLKAVTSVWLGSLPWSIPATLAVVRIVFFRGRWPNGSEYSGLDDTLLSFSAVLFFATALAMPDRPDAFLSLLPVVALISAREIARWTAGLGKEIGPAISVPESRTIEEGGPPGVEAPNTLRTGSGARARPADVRSLWSFNQVMTAIFCLLMLLLVATPLRLHRKNIDPIKDIAITASRLIPAGSKLGNFRQTYRIQAARLLFYGDRSLDPPCRKPEDVAGVFEDQPGKVFLSSAEDLDHLRGSREIQFDLKVFYRAGELVLFGMEE